MVTYVSHVFRACVVVVRTDVRNFDGVIYVSRIRACDHYEKIKVFLKR